jgi:hypothetical protein
MKVRKIEKKLSLNKSTIADLSVDEQKVLKGGTSATKLYDCETLPPRVCTRNGC